jgi:hypothetical protein
VPPGTCGVCLVVALVLGFRQVAAVFVIFGILVIIPGLGASQKTIDQAAGINLTLWVRAVMLAMGILFLAWILLKPPPPVTAAEADASRLAREEFGTHAPGGH